MVLSSPTPLHTIQMPKNYDVPVRQPKTLNMTMGMDFIKDMIQNGIPFRPTPPQFPSLKNLFNRSNGTQLSWVPLGSLIFNNNGKIIGG
ncbi:hypothetical protein Ocin01_04391 [Orchesella cincta]|uniref:Uncharacterized protein n=1 Tax=Orchesella cincta TaxID=48709 RepID=A0A1D2NAL5_ORCCI|nr:hypothetical protein Ocin01_04391 [Orchesella cincta]